MFYTLQQKNKTLGMTHRDRSYIIGFKKPLVARTVQYSLHPEPSICLKRGELIYKKGVWFDTDSMLILPKFQQGNAWDPINDGCFHMSTMADHEFYKLPFAKGVGIICPYTLIDESREFFVFRSHVVDVFM